MSIYIGNNNNVASKVINGYIGVNNVAHKIKKAYIGDANNIARLFWSTTLEQYVVSNNSSGSEALIYNVNDHLLTSKSTGIIVYSANYSNTFQYMVTRTTSSVSDSDINVYKRNGDTISFMQTISHTLLESTASLSSQLFFMATKGDYAHFSSDGKYMVLLGDITNGGIYMFRFAINSTGTQFDLIGWEELNISRSSVDNISHIAFSDDLSTFLISFYSTYYYINAFHGSVSSGGYTRLTTQNSNASSMIKVAISPNGKYFHYSTSTSNVVVGYIDGTSLYYKSFSATYFDTSSNFHSSAHVNDDGEVLIVYCSSNSGYVLTHLKITYSDGAVSYTPLNISTYLKSYLSNPSSTLNYNIVSDIVFTTDKSNCYALVGIGGSTYSSTVSILKINFDSSGALSSLTELGVSNASIDHSDAKLIGY